MTEKKDLIRIFSETTLANLCDPTDDDELTLLRSILRKHRIAMAGELLEGIVKGQFSRKKVERTLAWIFPKKGPPETEQ